MVLLETLGQSQIGRLRFFNDPDELKTVPLQNIRELIAYDETEDLLRYLLAQFSGVSSVSSVQPSIGSRFQRDEIQRREFKADYPWRNASRQRMGYGRLPVSCRQ